MCYAAHKEYFKIYKPVSFLRTVKHKSKPLINWGIFYYNFLQSYIV